MSVVDENTTVAIVGSGVAGLALGNFLLRSGIDCVILEKRGRQYVEQRQRAGVIDNRAARMFRQWGLEDKVLDGVPFEPVLNFRIDGETRPYAYSTDDGDGRFCPQQVLVRNLIDVFIGDGGDLRFDAEDVSLESVSGDERPLVRYRDSVGTTRTIHCDFIAGCDGDRGVSRATIPSGHLTRYAHDYGYAWLTVLAEVPANHSVHDGDPFPWLRRPVRPRSRGEPLLPPVSARQFPLGVDGRAHLGRDRDPLRRARADAGGGKSPASGWCRCAVWSTTR